VVFSESAGEKVHLARYNQSGEGDTSMSFVRIRISDPDREARGFVELAKRGRVICLPQHTYEVPKKHLKVLQEMRIPFVILKEESPIDALVSLRNPRSPKV
jgi:hypothetical protein